jgi:VanZ family protein
MATDWRQLRTWGVALGLTAGYAITDELHQGVTAGRHPSPVDVGIDSLGALIAIVAALVVARNRRG